MLSAVIAARGRKYLMMNAPATKLAELEALLPGLESPTVIPLAHEGMIAIHSVVGADEVWGLLPRLRPPARPGSSSCRSRRSSRDAPPTAPRRLRPAPPRPRAGRRRRGRADARERSIRRGRGARPGGPRGRAGDPRRRPGARRRRGPRGQRARSAAAGPTAASLLDRGDLARPRDALDPRVRRALDQAIEHVRRFAETQRPRSTRTTDRARASRSSAAGRRSASVGCYVPGRLGPLPVVAGDDRRAGTGRGRRAGSSSRPRRTATARSTRSSLGAAGLLEVDALRRRRRRPGDRRAGLRPARRRPRAGRPDRRPGQRLGHRRQDRGLRRGRHRPARRPVGGHGPRRRRRRPGRVAADLVTQAEHGPDSPAILVTTDAAFADAVEARGRRSLADAPRAATSSSAPRATTAGSSLAPDLDAAIDFVNALRARAPLGRRRAARADRRPGSATPARSSSGRGRRNRPATTRPAPTTSCRPAASRAASGGAGGRGLRQVHPGPADRPRRASPRSATRSRTLAEAEGLLAHRDAVDVRFDDRPGADGHR